MKRLEVFDPPMCCASGVCGPQVDKRLVRFAAALEWLRGQGVQVERYNPTRQYDAFVSNPAVVKTINERGTQCLPLLLADGEIVHLGGYPEKAELATLVGLGSADDVPT
jgi:hypothetical protein